MKKKHISWNDIDDAIKIIALKILQSKIKINAIKGLPRGGLIPAVLLSHQLDIPLLKEGEVPTKNTLIIDDICDSGETLKPYSSNYTATIHYKQSAKVKPNFYVDLAKENVWIQYPWESSDSKTIQDYLKEEENDTKL
jgi:hypoxanthine phosphoribosyltransferase